MSMILLFLLVSVTVPSPCALGSSLLLWQLCWWRKRPVKENQALAG